MTLNCIHWSYIICITSFFPTELKIGSGWFEKRFSVLIFRRLPPYFLLYFIFTKVYTKNSENNLLFYLYFLFSQVLYTELLKKLKLGLNLIMTAQFFFIFLSSLSLPLSLFQDIKIANGNTLYMRTTSVIVPIYRSHISGFFSLWKLLLH